MSIRYVLFVLSVMASFLPLWGEDKSFVVVILSYNNSQWYQKNLESVFEQTYDNYRVVYVDDCSDDGTYELVKQYVDDVGMHEKVTVVRNKVRRYALANHYRAVHMAADDEIIVQLDGDDWFKHSEVLSYLNQIYQDPDVWLTYGQYEMDPPEKAGISRELPPGVIARNAYREFNWVTSALRTFYAGLFKKIKLQDLLYGGGFYKAACDVAFMFPMLEMAAGRFQFIPNVLYVYNCYTDNNDFKQRLQLQLHLTYAIRARERYQRLSYEPHKHDRQYGQEKGIVCDHVNIILFAQNITEGFLSTVRQRVQGFDRCFWLCDGDADCFVDYARFPWLTVFSVSPDSYKARVETILSEINGEYVLCMAHEKNIAHRCDLSKAVSLLRQTQAHGFYFNLGKNSVVNSMLVRKQSVPPLVSLEAGVCAWQFQKGEYAWRMPHSLTMVLLNKQDLLQMITGLNFSSYESLQYGLNASAWDQYAVGLCNERSCI